MEGSFELIRTQAEGKTHLVLVEVYSECMSSPTNTQNRQNICYLANIRMPLSAPVLTMQVSWCKRL